MKVALCLSGQPRVALETFANIKKYIIEPNNADVFIHLNYDKNVNYIERSHLDNRVCTYPENIDDIVEKLYSPKRMLVETPKVFNNPNIKLTDLRIMRMREMNKHKQMTREEMIFHTKKQFMSMYYSIYKCNELKELYANENGFVYDYVIRLRFDALIDRELDCSKLDPNYIYYQELSQPDKLISDWINVGSNMIMNVYASIFLNLEYLNSFMFFKKEERLENTYEESNECAGGVEYNIRDIMTLFKIPSKHFNICRL